MSKLQYLPKTKRNRLAKLREAWRDWARWDESDGQSALTSSVAAMAKDGAPRKGFLHGIHCRLW